MSYYKLLSILFVISLLNSFGATQTDNSQDVEIQDTEVLEVSEVQDDQPQNAEEQFDQVDTNGVEDKDEEPHNCMHDKEYVEPDLLDVDELPLEEENSDDRLLRGTNYPKLRIATNYQYLNNVGRSTQSYIKNDLLPPVISYFENALHVKRPVRGYLRTNQRQICQYNTPSALRNGVNADHFFFFTAGRDANNYVATAMYCVLATDTKRPIISRVRFNLNFLEVPNGNHLTHEKNTYMLMHEMTHVLGFSFQLFPYFLTSNGRRMHGHIRHVNLNGHRRTVLDVPAITNRVRRHFGCSSLPGAYLENNGDPTLTAGSHFERRYFLVDMMTSGLLNTQRVTDMTLAVLESSGWYVPNYNYAEPNPYGAGQGCGFINQRCPSANNYFSELCGRRGQRGCFVTGRGGGKCQSDPMSDGCMYRSPTVNFDCQNPRAAKQTRLAKLQVFGHSAGSKCFDGTLSTMSHDAQGSFCFRYSCHGSGFSTKVTVQVGNRNIVCNRRGQVTVPGYRGTLNCPDPLHFCQTIGRPYCKRNCMGRGNCNNGRCICYRGFTGVDCSERT